MILLSIIIGLAALNGLRDFKYGFKNMKVNVLYVTRPRTIFKLVGGATVTAVGVVSSL